MRARHRWAKWKIISTKRKWKYLAIKRSVGVTRTRISVPGRQYRNLFSDLRSQMVRRNIDFSIRDIVDFDIHAYAHTHNATHTTLCGCHFWIDLYLHVILYQVLGWAHYIDEICPNQFPCRFTFERSDWIIEADIQWITLGRWVRIAWCGGGRGRSSGSCFWRCRRCCRRHWDSRWSISAASVLQVCWWWRTWIPLAAKVAKLSITR